MDAQEIAELNRKHGAGQPAQPAQAGPAPSHPGAIAGATKPLNQLPIGDYQGHVFMPAAPRWSSRPTGLNQFQIFDGERAVGQPLTPQDSATVLFWLTGKH